MSRTSHIWYVSAIGLSLAGASGTLACSRDTQAMTPEKVEQQYGVAGAYADTVATSEGSVKGTVVPVTLADGRKAQLLIPARSANDPHGVYIHDSNGLHPVQVSERANRNDVARAPAVVETRPDPPHAKKRSWEKDAMIIGGSAGAGTLIGAVAGGKKGAATGRSAQSHRRVLLVAELRQPTETYFREPLTHYTCLPFSPAGGPRFGYGDG